MAQGVDQPLVVALVQSDGGLVEDVANADQARADAGGQPDALQFAAAERVGGPLEREILDAHVRQKLETAVDLAQDRTGNRLILAREGQIAEPGPGGGDAHGRDLVNRLAVKAAGAGFGAQPGPAAILTRDKAAQLFEPGPLGRFERGDVLLLEHRQHAGKFSPVAVQELLADFGFELVEGRLPIEAGRLHPVAHLRFDAAQDGGGGPFPGDDGAVGQRHSIVPQDELRIELQPRAQSFATRAGAIRAVEAEGAGFELLEADFAFWAGVERAVELLGPHPLGVFGSRGPGGRFEAHHQHRPLAVRKRQPRRFGQPRVDASSDDDAIHDGFDAMVFARRQIAHLVDVQHFAVNPHAHEVFAHRGQDVLVLAFAAANQGGHDHQLGAFGQRQQIFDDLLGRLLADGGAALVTGCFAQTREQQPQVIVHFGDRGHGAARILAAGPLIDGNGGLESVDQIDVGAFHLVQELAGIDRQAFDILPLPFGEQGVESQRAFARSAGSGNHDQAVAGEIQVDVFQVVDAGAADGNGLRAVAADLAAARTFGGECHWLPGDGCFNNSATYEPITDGPAWQNRVARGIGRNAGCRHHRLAARAAQACSGGRQPADSGSRETDPKPRERRRYVPAPLARLIFFWGGIFIGGLSPTATCPGPCGAMT